MRLTDYDVLITLSRYSIDVLSERWLNLADGDKDMVSVMIEGSQIQIGAIGRDALHFRRTFGVSPTVAPIEPSPRALVKTLADLGHLKSGARVLVTTSRNRPPLAERSQGIAGVQSQLEGYGAAVDCVCTHALQPTAPEEVEDEYKLVRSGAVAAVVISSGEEVELALNGDTWLKDALSGASPPLLLVLGDEAQAALRETWDKIGEGGSIEVLELGARPEEDSVVEALESHFGAGKLLF
jgi:uroporphyrinogen-III synthase